MTKIVGLTGSIGTGKSTTAHMLKHLKIAVHEADHVVHQLLQEDAETIKAVGTMFPDAIKDHMVDRFALRQIVFNNLHALKKLEDILHPHVKKQHLAFMAYHTQHHTPLIVLDIPLLFEVGWATMCHTILVTHCDPALQRQRVLARPGMTEELYEHILAHQWPNDKRMAHADYILDTSHGLCDTFRQLAQLIRDCPEREISERASRSL